MAGKISQYYVLNKSNKDFSVFILLNLLVRQLKNCELNNFKTEAICCYSINGGLSGIDKLFYLDLYKY
jgi:hypothetical protein